MTLINLFCWSVKVFECWCIEENYVSYLYILNIFRNNIFYFRFMPTLLNAELKKKNMKMITNMDFTNSLLFQILKGAQSIFIEVFIKS